MEVRKPHIKSIPYNEFKDNDTLENIANELNEGGVNVVLGNLDQAINWGRSNSLWSLTFGTSCCGIEFMAVGCSRYDFSRFGFEVTRNSARQADLIMCAGTITNKMAPVFKRLYDEIAEPKYVVAVGGCTISGGPFKKSYHVVKGIDQIVPVDVYIPGCPPRPEAILYGMMQLQRKVKVEKFFGGANHKMTRDEKEMSMNLGGLHGISNETISNAKIGNRKPIIITGSPNKEEVERLSQELDALTAAGKEFEVNAPVAVKEEVAAVAPKVAAVASKAEEVKAAPVAEKAQPAEVVTPEVKMTDAATDNATENTNNK